MNMPICFLDTETDGLHPARKAWEIAMIRREPDGTEHRTEFFVDIDLDTADLMGLKIGRFYERHPYGRYLSGEIPDFAFGIKHDGHLLRPRDAAHEVARFTHGAYVVGIVPNFDTEVLANLLREQHLVPAWYYHLDDAETLAAGYLRGICAADTEPMADDIREVLTLPRKSEEISRALGVEPPAGDLRHTAMGDAVWAMRIYDHVTGYVANEAIR